MNTITRVTEIISVILAVWITKYGSVSLNYWLCKNVLNIHSHISVCNTGTGSLIILGIFSHL